MAKFEMVGLDKYQAFLSDLGKKSTGVIKRAVYVGGGEVADQIRRNLIATGHTDTGQLLKSLTTDKMQNDGGYIYTKISWTGYSEYKTKNGTRKVPNALKAAALESGVSGKAYPKTHFISRAVRAATVPASEKMSAQLDRDIENMQNKYGG